MASVTLSYELRRDRSAASGFSRKACRGIEERHGFAGVLRVLGGIEERHGFAGVLRAWGGIEERHGFAGVLRAWGGLGGHVGAPQFLSGRACGSRRGPDG